MSSQSTIAKLRAETGRPHWMVLDEAHHCMPAKSDAAAVTLPRDLPAVIGVTVHPEACASADRDGVVTVAKP